MVKVIDYKSAKNAQGESFVSLKLQGGVEAVQSSNTGKFYLTAKTCTIPSTFDEITAIALLDKEIPGCIKRVECEPYEYAIPETGEVIVRNHRFEYFPYEDDSQYAAADKGMQAINA